MCNRNAKAVHLFLNVSVKELRNFMRKYYLIAELLVFKYRWQNISVSLFLNFSTRQRSALDAWDRAAINLWNTASRLHRSSLICGQPTVLTWTRRRLPDLGSCRSVCIAAGFMTLTSWSYAWTNSGNISTRCSSTIEATRRLRLRSCIREHGAHFEHRI